MHADSTFLNLQNNRQPNWRQIQAELNDWILQVSHVGRFLYFLHPWCLSESESNAPLHDGMSSPYIRWNGSNHHGSINYGTLKSSHCVCPVECSSPSLHSYRIVVVPRRIRWTGLLAAHSKGTHSHRALSQLPADSEPVFRWVNFICSGYYMCLALAALFVRVISV